VAYLLDSNVVIPFLARDPATVPLVEHFALDGVAMSIVTYMEAYQGTLRGPDSVLAQARFEEILPEIPVLPFSLATAQGCARLREDLKSRGRRVRDRALDLVIAATAIEYDLQLVSRNRADFADIPQLTLYLLD
jgi:predicted nucleic acid-binding protein